MTEKERPTGINSEALTGKPNPPRMGERGDIFMPDSGQEGPPEGKGDGLEQPPEGALGQNLENKDLKEMSPEKATREPETEDVGGKDKPPREPPTADEILGSSGDEEGSGKESDEARDARKRLEFSVGISRTTAFVDKFGRGLVQKQQLKEEEIEGEIKNLEELAASIVMESPEDWRRLTSLHIKLENIRDMGTVEGTVSDKTIERLGQGINEKNAKIKADGLTRYARYIESVLFDAGINGKSYEPQIKEINELLREKNYEDLAKRCEGLANEVKRHYLNEKEMEVLRAQEKIPESLEDLAELIMRSESSEWKIGGAQELIDKEGKFHPENFISWIRSRIIYYHEFNPTTDINLFSMIQIPMLYRTITFNEMYETPRFFMKREDKLLVQETRDGGEVAGREHVSKKDKEYENLKEELLYEVWMFTMSHNFDVKYQQTMGIEKKLPDALMEIYYNNIFSQNKNRLLRILKMPTVSSSAEIGECLKSDTLEMQGSIGKAIRRSLLAYYHISDEKMFETVLDNGGEDGRGKEAFYTGVVEEIFKNEIAQIRKEKDRRGEDDSDVNIWENDRESFFELILSKTGSNGITRSEFYRLLGDRKQFALKSFAFFYPKAGKDDDLRDYASYTWGELEEKNLIKFDRLNIFDSPDKNQREFDIVRAGIKKVIETQEKLVEDLKAKIKEATYAEHWAYSFAYWTGIAARNDTEGICFNAWSKIINTSRYRKRQTEGKGIFGDLSTIYGIKRLGLNMWEGVYAKKEGERQMDKSLLEILQGGEGNLIDLTTFGDFEMYSTGQRQFAVNHIMNSFQAYDHILREHGINFEEILVRDPYGKLIIDKKKMDKVMDGIWKNLRYTFDLPNFRYGKKIRSWDFEEWKDGEKRGKVKGIVFEEKSLREAMFGKQINEMEMYKRKEFMRYESVQAARNVMAYLIEKQLEEHMQRTANSRRYSPMELWNIEDYFRNYSTRVMEDKKDYAVQVIDTFFSGKEWRKIAQMSHTTGWDIFKDELSISMPRAIIGAILIAAKKFASTVVSTK
ncbi:MAG: hypothetical protein COY68_04475 [Candidatus Levybacteria bacterium CG_4_10_14_0_8_um_filter_35_23]|nr:MAG: hypothetical protein COY68_04475 [Candidatus Levybacteria bacterium CG_4_10_14_0_8_um_filter_35_23]